VWFQEISIPTPRRVIGNSKGEEWLKNQSFKRKYELKLEFAEGWGEGISNKKNPCGWNMDIFFWNNILLHYQ